MLVFDKTDRAVVHKVTTLLLARWETAFREGVKWRFEHAAQERQRAVSEAEEAERRERQRREAEARSLRLKRQRLLIQASAGLRRSDQLRVLVAAVEAGASAGGLAADRVKTWKRWALEQANCIDPRAWSAAVLGQWLEEFDLRAPVQP